jgi:hypothetical protein
MVGAYERHHPPRGGYLADQSADLYAAPPPTHPPNRGDYAGIPSMTSVPPQVGDAGARTHVFLWITRPDRVCRSRRETVQESLR